MPVLISLLHDTRWQPAWRALLLVLMCVAAWFAFRPAMHQLRMDGADKFDHLLAFTALGLAARLAAAPGLRRSLLAASGLLLYGGFIELVQTQLPTRQGDWADLAANGVGVAAGLALATMLRAVVRR